MPPIGVMGHTSSSAQLCATHSLRSTVPHLPFIRHSRCCSPWLFAGQSIDATVLRGVSGQPSSAGHVCLSTPQGAHQPLQHPDMFTSPHAPLALQ